MKKMPYSIAIINIDKQGLCIAGDPGAIAAISPLWRKDIEKFGPWRQVDDHPLLTKGPGRAWLSGDPGAEPRIIICRECGSAMDATWRFIQDGLFPPWDSVLAVSQTAGRGRHGRTWISPPGNLHAAWRWPLPGDENIPESGWRNMISLLAGYVSAKALTDLSGLDIRLKWPNDLLIKDRKAGGILTELRSNDIVVGIGINVNTCPPDADLRHDFAAPATHLAAEGFDAGPLSLWTAFTQMAKMLFEELTTALSPPEFISVIRPMLAWVGRPVRIISGSDNIAGVITGISPDGGLCLNCKDGDIVIYSGSILPMA
jgi:BirA family biotin operon repressor/biotin-[acetyl-CoA-carboxylase] ligase